MDQQPLPHPLLRGEFCPMTTPKLASNVWTYVCWETSSKPGCRWLGTLPSVFLGVRNRLIFSSNLSKCLKWLQKALFMLCCCFKISRWVPLYTVQWLPVLHPRQGGGYSGFQLIGIVKNNSLFKPGKIHQEYKKNLNKPNYPKQYAKILYN